MQPAAQIPVNDADEQRAAKLPNSPTTAFASLSLDDLPTASTSKLAGEVDAATELVNALDAARKKPKPLIRATGHRVGRTSQHADGAEAEGHHLISWKTSEFAYRKSSSTGSELPTLARGLFTERLTTRDGSVKHKVAVRGYDKFFNLGEMPWTKPEAIKAFTTPPYVLTFKENGCIIFIAALSDDELVVTSKHSLGSLDGVTVTHAQKGEEWLGTHLARAGKTREQLAHELWTRNETAVFELCDDSFEEHVLEYAPEKSGLHLHGLNANSATFRTRPMEEVDAFAKEWGFIPTRYLELGSLAELHQLTDRIGMSGTWDGEAIEGFVIRTHMPSEERKGRSSPTHAANGSRDPVSPPYAPGQAWFYKVKFDEPYLMYRDWRELTRKMLSQKATWEKAIRGRTDGTIAEATTTTEAAPPPNAELSDPSALSTGKSATATDGTPADGLEGEGKVSKSQQKKERKKLERERRETEAKERAAAIQAGLAPPEPPQARSKRPETVLFIQWCYDRLYGSKDVKARPDLFASFNEGKGIIALRNAFLEYLKTEEGQRKLAALGGNSGDLAAAADKDTAQPTAKEDRRPFTKTVITPIAVPGCGKTVLAVALSDLFGFGHVQSDDFKGKKGFLAAVEKELQTQSVLFADKNNHLFQQRDELIELVQKLSDPNQVVKVPKKKKNAGKKGADATAAAEEAPTIPRIRTVALAWQLDALPLNALHRICSDRIVARGDNHQTLRADTVGAAGTRDHETILWRFLEQLQPYGSALSGEGSEGFGDAKFDEVIHLTVEQGLEQSLRTVVEDLCRVMQLETPSDERIQAALKKALEYKTTVKRDTKADKKGREVGAGGDASAGAGDEDAVTPLAPAAKVRYYGIAVELDLISTLSQLFEHPSSQVPDMDPAILRQGKAFFTRLRTDKRITLRPHITLIHSAVVAKEKELHASPDPSAAATVASDVQGATSRWERYASLCQDQNGGEVEFTMTLDRLIWDDRVMALSVRDVSSPSIADFGEVQGGRGGQGQGWWRPHVTVGTAASDIRPVEANRALMQAEAGSVEVFQLPLQGGGWRVKGRLQGMNH